MSIIVETSDNTTTPRAHNFSAGPSALPTAVLARAQRELLDWGGTGMSIVEMSHRDAGGPVQAAMTRVESRLRELLSIPPEYAVLLVHGGAHGQFAALPLNLSSEGQPLGYVETGFWSRRAREEAARFGPTALVAEASEGGWRLPEQSEWRVPAGAAYVHVCANETIQGLEYLSDPAHDGEAPLVADFTSTLLSRPVDVRRYGVIYASSGKNLGPSGFAVVIARRDLIARGARRATPFPDERPVPDPRRRHRARSALCPRGRGAGATPALRPPTLRRAAREPLQRCARRGHPRAHRFPRRVPPPRGLTGELERGKPDPLTSPRVSTPGKVSKETKRWLRGQRAWSRIAASAPDRHARWALLADRDSPGDALLARFKREQWPAQTRALRVFGLTLVVITMAGWATDVVWLGFSSRGWLLLGLRVLTALAVVPLLLATSRPEPPPWLERAKLLLLGAFPVLYQLIFTLKPTSMVLQGGIMVLLWLVLSLVIAVPLRRKHLVGLVTVAVYGVDLMYLWGQHGAAYGKPNEYITIWLLSVFTVLGMSWLPLSSEERSWREFGMREALRREVALRERREGELEASRDRAERAAVEAQQAASRAEFENRMRSAFVANISHDLRTPMAGILGLIELLRETPLNEEQIHYVETIRSSNQTLLALLNDILDFSRIEDGKLPLAPTTTALDKALRGPVELLRSLADRKGVELRVELDEGLPSHVRFDTARVQQMLLNLLGNAIKFTTRGAVTLRASATQRDGARWLQVEVQDTGIGFSQEQKERIFQRFSQADLSVARRFGGSGLGLAICKGLVELMGGSIDAEGKPGEGARFWFAIPVEIAAVPAAPAPVGAPPRLRVLLAEDNPINQLVLTTMLKKLGQDAQCVGNGQQALASLQCERFDLVLMDIQMPIMDGIEATAQLRASPGPNQRTIVVALTAGASPEERVACRQAGIDALYSKPIEMDRLRQLLCDEGARALGQRQAALSPETAQPFG